MPRNIRNFWLEASIDGQKTKLSGGPKSADGGFSLEIKQRDDGEIFTAATVSGFVGEDGHLRLVIEKRDDSDKWTAETLTSTIR